MKNFSNNKGKVFENNVEELLREVEKFFCNRVQVIAHEEIKLRDGRIKIIDFGFSYKTLSSNHKIAIECQDRESWSSEILDKILSLRNNSNRNRFWFVYNSADFLSNETKTLLDRHGIMHFSFKEFKEHLNYIKDDLAATENWISDKLHYSRVNDKNPPVDPAMLTNSKH